MQVLFDSNLRQANVVFNRAIKEMHSLQEFCVGFRSPLDFFRRSGAPRRWWVERICRVRGLRKFDLRFEDESFQFRLERLHYSDDGHGRRLGVCIQVLKQICQRSRSDQDATCQNWYVDRLNYIKLFAVDKVIGEILMDRVGPQYDEESDTEEESDLGSEWRM